MPLQLSREEVDALEDAVARAFSGWNSTTASTERERVCREIEQITAAAVERRLVPGTGDGVRALAVRFFLTRREIEVTQLVRKGLSSRQIGAVLGISVNTARRHIESVLAKLVVHSRVALVSRLENYWALLMTLPYVGSAIDFWDSGGQSLAATSFTSW